MNPPLQSSDILASARSLFLRPVPEHSATSLVARKLGPTPPSLASGALRVAFFSADLYPIATSLAFMARHSLESSGGQALVARFAI